MIFDAHIHVGEFPLFDVHLARNGPADRVMGDDAAQLLLGR